MLPSAKITGFVPSKELARARQFYEKTLGLRLLSEDDFALVFEAGGGLVRVTKVENFKPQEFTILGWVVPSIEDAARELEEKGVTFQRYGFKNQDARGIWTSPSGAKIAWFKDPDGNVLSISQLK